LQGLRRDPKILSAIVVITTNNAALPDQANPAERRAFFAEIIPRRWKMGEGQCA
jgi:hypothetical protein